MTRAVVVGSGPNGLAAAVRLAQAGLDVEVLEAATKIGGGTRSSELMRPGVLHDHCSAFHPLGVASPYLASLPLERYGLRWRWPEIDCAHPLDDGTAGLLYRDLDATARALASFGDIFWIAGGKPKTGGITSLAEFFPRIRKAYLIGDAAREFATTLDEFKVPYEISETLDAAVPNAARDAQAAGLADAVVLLSPACASFDQYRNFEVRGARFRELALALDGVAPMNTIEAPT